MFSAGEVAMGLTVVASVVPFVGGIIKGYRYARIEWGTSSEAPDSTLEDTKQIKVAVEGSPALEDTREIRIQPRPARARKSYIAGIGVLIALALFSVGLVWFIGRVQPAQSDTKHQPIILPPLGTPTHSSPTGSSGTPTPGSPVIATLVWLSARESFYQMLFLFAVLFAVLFNKRALAALVGRLDDSGQVLLVFAGIVLYFGGSAIIHYWHQISLTADKFYLAVGLFFTMIGGMFVQVITGNYKAGAASLFAVTTAQLIYPVLFSPIVYYAIWAVASSSSAGIFSFYAAFLNGYFWQSVVNSAQNATGGKQSPA